MLAGNSYVDQVKDMEVMFECMIVCSQVFTWMHVTLPFEMSQMDTRPLSHL